MKITFPRPETLASGIQADRPTPRKSFSVKSLRSRLTKFIDAAVLAQLPEDRRIPADDEANETMPDVMTFLADLEQRRCHLRQVLNATPTEPLE
jgi:hypothetical protein